MTKKKPGNKKQQKTNKTVKSVEKVLKKLAVSNESEPVADIEQDEKPEEIDGDQLEQNNEDINVEKESPTTTITEEEKTEEIDKGDNPEMKEVTRRHFGRKDNNPKNQRSKKHYKKSAEEHLPIEKSSISNENKSNSQQSKRKQNSKQDNISANRDYSKDRLPTEEQPISSRDRSASGDRWNPSSSKHADKEQKTDARGRSKSGNRQDKASSSKSPDFRSKDRGNQNIRQDRDKYGNRQNSSNSFRNPKSKISEQERSTNETHWDSSDSNNKFQEYQNPRQNRRQYRNHPNNNSPRNANNFKGQQTVEWKRGSNRQDANSSKNPNFYKEYEKRKEEDSNRFSNESKREYYNKSRNKFENRQDSRYNQSRPKSHRERSRSNNRQSYNETNKNDTPNETETWEDFEDSSINFSNSNIDTSQNNSWVDDDDDKWKMPQQRKSRDSNRSSNLNDSQMSQSLKDIDVGILFDQYEKEFFKTKNKEYHRVKEIFGDLFEAPEDCSLGHCVAEDMGMGSGIAVQFRQKFRQVDELLDQRQKQGGLAILKDKDRFIYYLVTKQVSNGKPTYQSLFKSLCKMKRHIFENGVKKLALPRIGCGLDRLEWEDVKYMLEFLFRDVDIEIIVYNFQQDNESTTTTTTTTRIRNCKVVHESYPIEEIAPETIIIYLSSEDGEVTEDMENLDKKFVFLNKFKFAPKRIGEIIKFETNNFYLYGCIVKKTKDDLINFKSLQRCISKINGENRKLQFGYVGFQAIDNPDEIINNKIINILRNTFRNVDVYICYPEKLRYLIPPSRDSFY